MHGIKVTFVTSRKPDDLARVLNERGFDVVPVGNDQRTVCLDFLFQGDDRDRSLRRITDVISDLCPMVARIKYEMIVTTDGQNVRKTIERKR